MMRCVLLSAVLACLAASTVPAQEPDKPARGLELKLIANKDTYAWDAAGKTPKELRKRLDELAEEVKKNPFGGPELPAPPKVDLTLRIVNNGKEEVTIWVEGDPNEVTLDLKGPDAVALKGSGVFTRELRLAREVKLGPGKHHDIRISRLADGFRGASRFIYWARPGEYTLKAKYRLAAGPEEKGKVLESNAVKLKVTAPEAGK